MDPQIRHLAPGGVGVGDVRAEKEEESQGELSLMRLAVRNARGRCDRLFSLSEDFYGRPRRSITFCDFENGAGRRERIF